MRDLILRLPACKAGALADSNRVGDTENADSEVGSEPRCTAGRNERAKTTTSDPGNNSVADPDLAAVVNACSTLPEAVKMSIVAMVKARK